MAKYQSKRKLKSQEYSIQIFIDLFTLLPIKIFIVFFPSFVMNFVCNFLFDEILILYCKIGKGKKYFCLNFDYFYHIDF